MKQRSIFLNGEGDAWFKRNLGVVESRDEDPVLDLMAALNYSDVLEVGCSGGKRLATIASQGALVYGIDPSAAAVDHARRRGLANVVRGTADRLPFVADFFDVVIFGFCLYLCDREDLFTIASEADRVLRPNGHIIIHDFDAAPGERPYKHHEGVKSYRMHYPGMWTWHPRYTLLARTEADDDEAWVSLVKKWP